ncbi:MAG: nitrous oxide reductase family maturation protein NosD [Flavobacteriaceae bacterium]|nr:nitrous oxide reductase family maturation protein NosD [Flavobacteriaceae bacterium]
MTGIRIYCSIIILFVCANVLNAKTITVCNSCGVKSIKEAISQAQPGDQIIVQEGIYKEYDLIINKKLSIIGEGNVIVDGEKKGGIFIISQSDGVTLKNLTIQNVGNSYSADYAAVRVTQSTNFHLENLKLRQFYFGIHVGKSSNGQILNNDIRGDAKDEYNSGNGVHLWYSEKVEIKNNYISGCRDGIYFEFANFCKIESNYTTKNIRYGLHFMFSNNDEYINNVFTENAAGVAVMFSKKINMIGNVFKKNWGASSYGLLLKEISDAEILNNTFEENSTGIQIDGTTRINYFNNKFNNNGWAMKVAGAAYSNIIKKNNFSNNSFDLAYNSNINDNLFEENYWSDYNGYDLNKDGFGDVPYRPVKLFSYIVDKTPEAIILLRSLFVSIINFSERVSPVFTPDNLMDNKPKMTPYP